MDSVLKMATASNVIKAAKFGGKYGAVGGAIYLIMGNDIWSGYSDQSLIDPGNEGKTYSAARSFASGIDNQLGGSYLSQLWMDSQGQDQRKIGSPIELNLASKWNRAVDATLGTLAHGPYNVVNFAKKSLGLQKSEE